MQQPLGASCDSRNTRAQVPVLKRSVSARQWPWPGGRAVLLFCAADSAKSAVSGLLRAGSLSSEPDVVQTSEEKWKLDTPSTHSSGLNFVTFALAFFGTVGIKRSFSFEDVPLKRI